jgi:RecB family exonuclease
LGIEHWALSSPTPRQTRLIRVPDLQAFRSALVALATEGPPLAARDRLVIVPTHAAASLLVRSIEDARLDEARAVVLPAFITSRELTTRLGERLDPRAAPTPHEREVLLGLSCRAAREKGIEPPFRLRPGLIAEILRLYDELRRRRNGIDDFERRTLGLLAPGAATDRGAERLVRQTAFLVAAFREFERRALECGEDEHHLRARLIAEPAGHPVRHIVLGVTDEAFDPYGLRAADWDLLTRLPGLERLDAVVTESMLAGALHERMHHLLPGVEEIRQEPPADRRMPALVIPPGGGSVHVARDREEEVAHFARRVKAAVRHGSLSSPGQVALVVRQRLPYVYVAREVLRSAGVPCQMLDAVPLAAEPYVAAVDLVLSCVGADFARVPAVALLRSPLFRFAPARDVSALDHGLAEAGYLGGIDTLERLLDVWRAADPSRSRVDRAIRAGTTLLEIARELAALRSPAPPADHLRTLLAFLAARERLPEADDPLRAGHLRARGAILSTLTALRDAYARLDPAPITGDEVSALVRRWIEGQTFAPRTGEGGVHLVDADSARFGEFEQVHIAGLVEGEWPDPARRSIFYSSAVLRELGWPAESDRLAGARAAFADLLGLARSRVSVSTFSLEADALVSPSAFIDEVDQAGLDPIEEAVPAHRIFDHEALCLDPVEVRALGVHAREWVARRVRLAGGPVERFHGFTAPPPARPWSLSALERYQDCPFKFFAADVLRLEEVPEDESTLSPRARGRFVHEVFQRFFEAWAARGRGAVTSENLDEARALMAEVAEPLLARLPHADAALERTRLFGSAISTGSVDIVFGHEASTAGEVEERWLEYRFEGEFGLGAPDGRRVALKGVADRVDLLTNHRMRVIDYKSGSAPNASRALQVPIYALCVQERLQDRDGAPWAVDEAIYLAFSGRRSQTTVVKAGDAEAAGTLAAARGRLLRLLDGIGEGRFPPQPHDPILCDFCAYSAVCRKDYVHD